MSSNRNVKSINLSPEEMEILKLRMSYSWNWFDLHAKQRMSLFYYFLLITGILVNAYVLAVINQINILAIAVCVIGVFQASGFIAFDIRSRQLTEYGEDVMEKLERDIVFPDDFLDPKINHGKTLGLLRRDSDNEMREGQKSRKFSFFIRRLKKMKFWIRLIQILVSATFIAGLIGLIL